MYVFTQILLPLSLKASAIFLFIFVLTKFKASASNKYFMWQCFFIIMLFLPLSFLLPTWHPTMSEQVPEPIQHTISVVNNIMPKNVGVEQAIPKQEKTESTQANVMPIFFIIVWFSGILLFLLKMLRSTHRVRILISQAQEFDLIRVNRYRYVRLLCSDKIATPMTTGIFRPVILLPADFEKKSAHAQQFIIQHEMSHVYRFDASMMLLVNTLTALYWFNPLIWVARRQLELLREHACDDYVVSKFKKPQAYAEMLLGIARETVNHPLQLETAMSMASKSQLEGRLMAILDNKVKRTPLSRPHSTVLFVLIVLFTLPVATLSLTQKTTHQAPVKSLAEEIENSLVVESLLSVLHDNDSDVRDEAFRTMGRIPGTEAVAALERALASDNWDVRSRAARRLTEIGQHDSVAEQMLALLEHEKAWVRRKAVRTLRGNQNALVRQELEKLALRDPHPGVREDAVESLAGIGNPKSLPVFEKALTDEHIQVSEEAAKALGGIAHPEAQTLLLNALKHPQVKIRLSVIDKLGDIHCRAATIPLIAMLDDENAKIRRECIESLTNIGDPRSINPIINKLYDSDRHVREKAAEALGVICDANALIPLTQLLKDEDSEVREEAADALGNIYKKLYTENQQ